MGKACRIIKNEQGEIQTVLKEDGSPSLLYNEALRYTKDSKEAVKIVFEAEDIKKEATVYITPATVRSFDLKTERLKTLTEEYDKITKNIYNNKSIDEKKFLSLQKQILEETQKELETELNKIEGVGVTFGSPYIGSWGDGFEPSLNMKITATKNKKQVDEILYNLAEQTSQDAFIVEEDSEYEEVLLSEEKNGYTYYPQVEVQFEKELSVSDKVQIIQMLNKEGISEMSVDGDFFRVSIFDFKSETQKQKKEYYERIREKTRGVATRINSYARVRSYEVLHKKSKYVSSRTLSYEGGEQTQTREYSRSNIFEEPSLEEVLNFLNAKKTDKPLTINEKISAMKGTITGNFGSLSEYYKALNTLFFNKGKFEINATKLKNSKVFSVKEINDILYDKELQETIKTNILRLGDTVRTTDTEVPTTTKLFAGFKENTKNIFGQYESRNPYEVEKELSKTLAGITDYKEFLNALTTIEDENVQTELQTNSKFKKDLFKYFSNIRKVDVYSEADGVVSDTPTTNELLETVSSDISKDANGLVSYLTKLESFFWRNSEKEVKGILSKIEKHAVENSIDLVGLADTYDTKTYDEVVPFLDDYYTFLRSIQNGTATQDSVKEFGDRVNEYFSREAKETEILHTKENKSFVKLDTDLNDNDIFDQQSLIRVKDNLFRKVETSDAPLELLTSLVRNNPTLIPQEYLSFAVSNGVLDWAEVRDVRNSDMIRQSVMSYMTQQRGELSESLFLHKVIYGEKISPSKESKATVTTQNFDGDYKYLTTDFITDFYKKAVLNKYLNTEEYQNLYRHFGYNEKGIYLRNTDPITKNIIKEQLGLEENKDLKEYIKINKSLSREGLVEEPEYVENTSLFAVNNKALAPEPDVDYMIEDRRLITKGISKEAHFRVGDNIYEKMQDYGTVSFYSQINSASLDNRFHQLVHLNTETNFEPLGYTETLVKDDSKVTNNFLLSSKESQQIEQTFSC